MQARIEDIRTDYKKASLAIHFMEQDPIKQFNKWFEEAVHANVEEVNAMTLATLDHEGFPSARIVLLKHLDADGFVFYTNYESQKGQEIASHPKAALVFFWPDLQRQVRVKGTVIKVSESQATDYFHSRPEGSQIGAWASPQSKTIPTRQFLEEQVTHYVTQFKNNIIPKPAYWGGYSLQPISIEFWQGRPNRLHDRLIYTLTSKKTWEISRLAP